MSPAPSSSAVPGKTAAYRVLLAALLLLTLGVPFILSRPHRPAAAAPDARLIIITPHNEAIRHEFEKAFTKWHKARFGAEVYLDWRNVGGTSEIARYLDGEFEAAKQAGREGIGADLFFGGGGYDHARQTARGNTMPCGLRERHAEWLAPEIIPSSFSGEQYYDAEDRWYGCCLSSFGICYNTEALADAGIGRAPEHWADLAAPEYYKKIALADPTKSGSIAKAFEMVIQHAMSEALAKAGIQPDEASAAELAEAWRTALVLLRKISANARYFTDSSSHVPLDVAQGNAVAGMCIDFYGRFQSELVRTQERSERMRYLTPAAGASLSVDPISMLKGAPHRELAERFVDFVMSEDGQKLWNYRAGEQGGPERYALRRLPIRRDMYSAEHLAHMSDPDAMPYEKAAGFRYRKEWTGPLFNLIRSLIRAMCMDTHAELSEARRAVVEAGGEAACPAAMREFGALPENLEFGRAAETAADMNDKLKETRMCREWTVFFRRSYTRARALAEKERVQ